MTPQEDEWGGRVMVAPRMTDSELLFSIAGVPG